jgi:protein-S-isoprenylcysteine O-methyltransferase Ste14
MLSQRRALQREMPAGSQNGTALLATRQGTASLPGFAMTVQTWNLVFLAGFVVYIGIRHVFIKRTAGHEKTVRRLDALEKTLLPAVTVGALLLPLFYIASPWLAFADYRLPAFLPWCGTAFMVAGLWLFYRSHADLGVNWSVTLELRKGHELVKEGVYRRIRHPMYAAIFLFSIAQGLMLSNWLAGWSGLATFAVLYFVRTPREERMMCESFGQDYQEYMQQTGRLFPRIKRRP